MYMRKTDTAKAVSLADATPMTRADLPDPQTRRWVASRKAAVLHGISAGLIARDEALKLYDLSEEELDGWAAAMRTHGELGLKTTATQAIRQP